MPIRPSFAAVATLSLAALTISFTSPVRAEGPGDRWSQRPLALHAVAALPGGPVGLVGAELDYAATPWLGIVGAVGLGLTEKVQGRFLTPLPRANIGARYRLKVNDGFAVSLGPTVSIGRSYRPEFAFDDQDGASSVMDVPVAIWLGAQTAFEFRLSSGVSVKALIGVERTLNTGSADCYQVSRSGPDAGTRLGNIPCGAVHPLGFDPWFPSTGVAVGYAF
jgi:hypothetical protein